MRPFRDWQAYYEQCLLCHEQCRYEDEISYDICAGRKYRTIITKPFREFPLSKFYTDPPLNYRPYIICNKCLAAQPISERVKTIFREAAHTELLAEKERTKDRILDIIKQYDKDIEEQRKTGRHIGTTGTINQSPDGNQEAI